MTTVLIVYYKSPPLEELSKVYGYNSNYYPLFSDKECTKQIGYNYVDYSRNIIDTNNVTFLVNKTFFILDNIFKISYVKNNDDDFIVPVIYYNKWKNKSNELGTVQRKVFNDGLVRELVITLFV